MIRCDVAVVGGGFSGCAIAAQLARHAPADFSLTLFEPVGLGRGAAYGGAHAEHLLNTRASQMSLFPDDPQHFVRWLGPRATPADFVSRRTYGDYLEAHARRAFERPRFSIVASRVASISHDGAFVLETASGARFEARAVVIATGNPAPRSDVLPPAIAFHPGYVADPWRFDYRPVGGHVLVIGAGLSALDVLVALDSCGHRGAVDVVSRHGRFPAVHADNVAAYDVVPALETANATALLRSFRRHVRDAAARGFDWRAVVESLRPECESHWKRLTLSERRRFERHLRSHWDRHRHRAPQQVDAIRARYERAGRLRVHAGRVLAADGRSVTLALSGDRTLDVHPDWIVNCLGIGNAGRLLAAEPLAGLARAGLVAPDQLGAGIRVDDDCVAIGASGARTDGLWVVGTPLRGSRFETTAVGELRSMAESVAGQLLRSATRAERAIS